MTLVMAELLDDRMLFLDIVDKFLVVRGGGGHILW